MTDRELLTQALEALVSWKISHREVAKTVEALRERLAREEQEPACSYIRSSKEGTHWCALAEQPREWVGLTEKERFQVADVSDCFEDVVEAVEAKLREKNT